MRDMYPVSLLFSNNIKSSFKSGIESMFPLIIRDDRGALPIADWALGYPRRHFSVSLMKTLLDIVQHFDGRVELYI